MTRAVFHKPETDALGGYIQKVWTFARSESEARAIEAAIRAVPAASAFVPFPPNCDGINPDAFGASAVPFDPPETPILAARQFAHATDTDGEDGCIGSVCRAE